MSKLAQRIAATIVMVAIVMGATVWGAASMTISYKEIRSDAPVVMTINGDEVRADEYAGILFNYMLYYDSMYAQFGITDIWNDEQMGQAMIQMVRDAVYDQVVSSHILLQQFRALGLSLSFNEQKELQRQLTDTIESVGGMETYEALIAGMGFTPDSYSNMMYSSACYRALNEYYYGEHGVNRPSDEELTQYFQQNYLAAKHILLLTTDPSTGEQLRTEEQAREEAQAILDRINAGEDFDTLMHEYSEDTGLASNPDGYIFTQGEMVDEFYQAAAALAEGEVSGLVQSSYGYHIVKREPIDYAAELENYRDGLTTAMGLTIDGLLNEWMEQAQVETTAAYEEITYDNVRDYLPASVQAILDEEDAIAQAAQQAADVAGQTDGADAASGAQ